MARRIVDAKIDDRIVNEGYDLVRVGELVLHPKNPRRGDVSLVRALIRENGFHGALLVQSSTRRVLIGNHRLMAARAEDLAVVPVIWADVGDEHAERILLSDNRASDVGGYDEALLATLLGDVSELVGTGYSDKDLASLLRRVEPPEDFKEYGSDVETTHKCPKCGYEWS